MTLSAKLQQFLRRVLTDFPWQIEVCDWCGSRYQLGQGVEHWSGRILRVEIHTAAAGKILLGLNGLGFLEKYLQGEVDFEGNFFVLTDIRKYLNVDLNAWQYLAALVRNHFFQDRKRARTNVKSHYDIPQTLLDGYLDQCYHAYSCAMFESTELSQQCLAELATPGEGEKDSFDSLEKAQWRKFKDAIDFLEPRHGDTLLDIGCGYAGQLQVALENPGFSQVVGWTHSHNQVLRGRVVLKDFDPERWLLHEGDYRDEVGQFNHITSTGMVSHVGPRGLGPYLRNVRQRIRTGGRYLHHSLMMTPGNKPLDARVGAAFNKRYVWPGFHWFSLAQHVEQLQQNGFHIEKMINLRTQYSKTIVAWHERMMAQESRMKKHLDEATFRAWRLYLGGCAGSDTGDVYRIYCTAI